MKRDRASELRAIADGRLMLNVRNGVTVSRSMLAMIADEIDALRAAPPTPAEVGGLVERLNTIADIIEMGERIAWGSDTAIMREAATSLASERAAHAQTTRERDELKADIDSYAEASSNLATELYKTEARLEALEADKARLREALEPFAEIAGEPWADENGWTNAACQNDRICDWFGLSAFRTARRALGGKVDG